jgi:hypothetical protein
MLLRALTTYTQHRDRTTAAYLGRSACRRPPRPRLAPVAASAGPLLGRRRTRGPAAGAGNRCCRSAPRLLDAAVAAVAAGPSPRCSGLSPRSTVAAICQAGPFWVPCVGVGGLGVCRCGSASRVLCGVSGSVSGATGAGLRVASALGGELGKRAVWRVGARSAGWSIPGCWGAVRSLRRPVRRHFLGPGYATDQAKH